MTPEQEARIEAIKHRLILDEQAAVARIMAEGDAVGAIRIALARKAREQAAEAVGANMPGGPRDG